MEIAIFGGTFDPPTKAHELVMHHCLELPGVDELWVMPSAERLDKPGMGPVNHRQAMLEALKQSEFALEPKLVVSDFEMDLPPPSRTSETVKALRCAYPEHRFWFVYGADTYYQMPTWSGGLELRSELPMILVEREGYELPPEGERIQHVSTSSFIIKAISSTLVRQRLEHGEPIDDLVSPAVEHYIACNGLYKALQLSGHGTN